LSTVCPVPGLRVYNRSMKHLSYADKTIFVDDATADALVEYAGLLAAEQSGDTVTVRAIGQDGNEVEASFVLNSGTNLVAESTTADVEAPANSTEVAYMRERIQLIRNPPQALPLEEETEPLLDDAGVREWESD
jgi:hypothetical protein